MHVILSFTYIYVALQAMPSALAGDGPSVQRRSAASLQQAAAYGETDEVRRILALGGEVDARGPAGHTALTLAAQEGHADVVALLLEAGANPDATSDAGATAAALARGYGHRDVLRALAQHGQTTAAWSPTDSWWAVMAAAALGLVVVSTARDLRRYLARGGSHACGCAHPRV